MHFSKILFIFHNCNCLLKIPAGTQPLHTISQPAQGAMLPWEAPAALRTRHWSAFKGFHKRQLWSRLHVSCWWKGRCFMFWAILPQDVKMRSKWENENSLHAVSVELVWAFFGLRVLTGNLPLWALPLNPDYDWTSTPIKPCLVFNQSGIARQDFAVPGPVLQPP